MLHSIIKDQPKGAGQMISNRYSIKGFKHKDDMFKFLGKQCDNAWKEISQSLASGSYSSRLNKDRTTGKYTTEYVRLGQ